MHSHKSCLPGERVWCSTNEGDPTTTRKRYYCVKCGLVNIADGQRAKRLGYFQNCLAQISTILKKKRKPKITQAQKRLIMRELEKNSISDDFIRSYRDQKEIFIGTVQKYKPLRKKLIEKVL